MTYRQILQQTPINDRILYSRTTRIAINARSLGHRTTGVERYTREVAARLDLPFRMIAAPRIQGVAGHLWEQFALPRYVRKEDILWSPANSGPLARPNQVLSIYDLSVIDHPEWFDPKYGAWYGWLLPRLVQQVKIILTTSIHSSIRIQQVLRICESKIRVAPGGVNRDVFRPRSKAEQGRVRRMYALPETYLLFVGSQQPRKNLGVLVQAWRYVHARHPRLHLVIAGAGGKQFPKIESGTAGDDPGIHWLGRVEDTDLPALYSGAHLFVWPSLYEGFGLPPLEAMACGVPVITSNTTCLPEVVGDAARLVSPRSVDQLAAAISDLTDDTRLREEYVRKGFNRVEAFTWERTASQVQEALELAGQ